MRRALPLGHAEFGRVQPCPCAAEEGEQQRQGRLQRYSNLGPLTRLTFDALDPARSAPFAAATDAARAFVRDARGWLVLWGASGSGKTALAAAMANERIARGAPALYVVVPDLLDHLRAAYGSDAEIPFPRLFQQVRDAPFLILDDLDAGNPTAWAQEKFFQLINHRFNGQLPTVLLTLTPPRKLPERLRSRLDGPGSRPHALPRRGRGRRLQADRGDDARPPGALQLRSLPPRGRRRDPGGGAQSRPRAGDGSAVEPSPEGLAHLHGRQRLRQDASGGGDRA